MFQYLSGRRATKRKLSRLVNRTWMGSYIEREATTGGYRYFGQIEEGSEDSDFLKKRGCVLTTFFGQDKQRGGAKTEQ